MPTSLTIAAFDPLAWINEYTSPAISISSHEFEPILQFSLVWNLFERDACGKEANPTSIEKAVNEAFTGGRLDATRFEEHLQFFKERARMNGGTIEQFFAALILTNDRAKQVVRGALDGTLRDPNNLVYALLLIAHRIRNNLFHGNKEVALLHSQVDFFKAVNSLLATFLDVKKAS